MNLWGCDKCEEKVDEIAEWMQQEAWRRKLPAPRIILKQLIRIAIRRARKKEKAHV
jgi:hypothetical protein